MLFLLGIADTSSDKLELFTDVAAAEALADEWVAIDAPDVITAALHYEDAFNYWQKHAQTTPYVVTAGQIPKQKTEFIF